MGGSQKPFRSDWQSSAIQLWNKIFTFVGRLSIKIKIGVDSEKRFTTQRREGTSVQTPPAQIDSDTFFNRYFPPKSMYVNIIMTFGEPISTSETS